MPPPLTEDALDEKRVSILEAARAVCRETGLDGIKMADIAARARVSKGTLYRFFDSKEDLLTDMVIVEQERCLRELQQIERNGAGVVDQLAAVIRTCTQGRTAENVSLNIQALGVAQRSPRTAEKVGSKLKDLYNQQQAVIERVIATGTHSGELRRGMDAEAAAAALMGFCDGYSYRASFDPRFAEAALTARLFEHVVAIGRPERQQVA